MLPRSRPAIPGRHYPGRKVHFTAAQAAERRAFSAKRLHLKTDNFSKPKEDSGFHVGPARCAEPNLLEVRFKRANAV